MPNYSGRAAAARNKRAMVPAPIERIKPKFELLYGEFDKKKEQGIIKVRTNERAARRYEERTGYKRMFMGFLVALIPFAGVWLISSVGKWGTDTLNERDNKLQSQQASAQATFFAKVTVVALSGPGVGGTPALSPVRVEGGVGASATVGVPTAAEAFPRGIGYTADDFWKAFGGKGPAPTPVKVVPSPGP